MKVLNLSVLLCLLSSSIVVAKDNTVTLDTYISDYKKDQFKYDYQKNEAEGSKLRDSWIAPIRLNYSLSKSKPYAAEQTNQNAAIKMDQPIFQSGGIYYGIKFAQASRLFADYSVDVAKRKIIKETIAILMQIKQTELLEEKQKLQIINSDINLAQIREQYLSGQADSGFLDNAVIQKNLVTQALYDIQTTKQRLISKFQALSDLDYEKAFIPYLEFINNEDFIKYNIVLKQSQSEVEKNRYYKDVTVAKYLPSVNFTAGYNWQRTENQQFSPVIPAFSNEISYYDYGVKASLPLDLNTFRSIESVKVDFLKSEVTTKDKERELNALFEQVMQNIENFDKKIRLSDESIEIYTKLLADTNDLFSAGYKTQYDVDTLHNSLKIQTINSKVFGIDKQLELLTLYEMYVNNGE